jgi:hypothetical protein
LTGRRGASRDRFSVKVKHVSNVWWRCVCVAIPYRMGFAHLEGGIRVIWRTTLAFVLRRMGEHVPARATTRPMRKMLCK